MKKFIITGAGIILLGGLGYALMTQPTTTAEEVPPLVQQVDNHEKRIGDLEVKTDNIQQQANQNTADIQQVKNSDSQPTEQPSPTTPSQDTVATPEPNSESESPSIDQTDPKTIVSVDVELGLPTDKNPHPLKTCTYHLYDETLEVVLMPSDKQCQPVGAVFSVEA